MLRMPIPSIYRISRCPVRLLQNFQGNVLNVLLRPILLILFYKE